MMNNAVFFTNKVRNTGHWGSRGAFLNLFGSVKLLARKKLLKEPITISKNKSDQGNLIQGKINYN